MTSGDAGGNCPWEDARRRSLRAFGGNTPEGGSLRREGSWRALDCLGIGGGAVEASMLDGPGGFSGKSGVTELRSQGARKDRTVCGECLVGGPVVEADSGMLAGTRKSGEVLSKGIQISLYVYAGHTQTVCCTVSVPCRLVVVSRISVDLAAVR